MNLTDELRKLAELHARKYAAVILLMTASALLAQDAERKKQTSVRFHSGSVLAAEILPDNPEIPIIVKRVSPLEPPSRITSDVAYAAVTVKLDPGRSLSVYDYVLVNKRKDEFKCIGIREEEGDYDYEKWEFDTTRADKLYTLLFKVQLPSFNEGMSYSLRFALNKSKVEELSLPFVKIGGPFTSPSKIPAEGMLGIDPSKTVEVKAETAKAGEPKAGKPAENAKKTEEPPKKAETASPEGMKVDKSAKWCALTYPEKSSVGQTMEVKAKITGLKAPTKLCADLHCRTTGRVYAGPYSSAEPQEIKADGEYTFKFDIKDKDNLESVHLLVFQSPTGNFDDQKASVTGPDIMISGATKVAVPEKPVIAKEEAGKKLPIDDGGYIRSWLALPAIPLNTNISHTEEMLKPFLQKDFFPNQKTATPKENDKVAVDGREMAWKAYHTDDPCWKFNSPVDNSLYYVVAYVIAEQDIPNVILSIGSDDGSMWTVNGVEAIRVYAGRAVEKDTDRSQPLTLKKGTNVIRALIINGGGDAGVCARLVDKDGNPVKNIKVATAPAK
ncbi:MAG TPA: hypothetical protein DCZ94_02880 [Lentisphaeria bacterium]|nr:MAG: hypothetical protein A2X48_03555 [Lentisphaerae bacterium GWF2_49_21]HBC85878.1 hypothetical protein [Lentisphaeria bacterium]